MYRDPKEVIAVKKLLILLVLLILCVSAAQAEVVRKGDLICADIESEFLQIVEFITIMHILILMFRDCMWGKM